MVAPNYLKVVNPISAQIAVNSECQNVRQLLAS